MEVKIKELFKKYETEEYIGKNIVDLTDYPQFIYLLGPYKNTKKKRLIIYKDSPHLRWIDTITYGANHQEAYCNVYIRTNDNNTIYVNLPDFFKETDFEYGHINKVYFFKEHLIRQINDLNIGYDKFNDLFRYSYEVSNFDVSNLSELIGLSRKYIDIAIKKDRPFKIIKQYRDKGFSPDELDQIHVLHDDYYIKSDFNKDQIKFLGELECVKHHRCWEYTDYLRLRESCKHISNKHYPLIPTIESISQFHNELVKIYDEYLEILQKKELEAKQNNYIQIHYPNAVKYEYENNKYSIVACHDLVDLKKEGKALHHCVGSYINSVSEGREYILFLRKKSEINVPFFTIDIDTENKVRQIHGLCNCNLTEELKPFIKEWAKKNELDISNCSGVKCALI